MEVLMRVVDGLFLSLFLVWLVMEVLKERRRGVVPIELRKSNEERKCRVVAEISVLCCVLISLFHLGFCLYGVWKYRTVSIESIESVVLTVTWISMTVFAIYSKNRNVVEDKKWPSVLTFWWISSCVFNAFCFSIYILSHLKYFTYPTFIPKASLSDFAAFPLYLILCINALYFVCVKKPVDELKDPLLEKDDENVDEDVVGDAFSNAGIWSKHTFGWLNPLFQTGRRKKLELPHIPQVPGIDSAEKSFLLLQESLQNQETEGFPLAKAIIHAVWRPLLMNGLYAGANTVSSYMGPLLITYFVNFLSGKYDDDSRHNLYGLLLALIFFCSKTVESLSQRQWYFGARRIGVRVRAGLIVLIYKKSLSLKSSSSSNGNIVNLINVDVERIGDFFWFIHGVWLLPIQVFLALIILYKNLGAIPSIAALLSTILVMVSNTPLVKLQERMHSKIMKAKDSRIKATSETLKSMRILKLHSWETIYKENIINLREVESNSLKRYLYICSVIAFLFWTSPTVVSVVTFGICILVKIPLTAGTVLSALATFRVLQDPIYNLPELISTIAQTKVSLDRLQEFIKEGERQRLLPFYNAYMSDVAIEIEKGEYSWDTSDSNLNKPAISISENMKLKKGSKIAVCGSVGSGKSSFLCGILGEIPRTSGLGVKVHGSKAYVPQSAWIQTGTIQENVLFGKDMDAKFYADVLNGCALNRDVEMWTNGDKTVVGERGINLSGGQKQRVQLARAIYSDSDVYLLDDPFSAVDAHTGAHLFEECLMRLLSRKTVIYVTHQLEFLSSSDMVLVMKDGKIVQSGKYEELIAVSDGELVRLMAAHSQSVSQVNSAQDCELNPVNQTEATSGKPDADYDNGTLQDINHEEETESGRVKWHVYSTFMTLAYKGALVPIILLCHVLFQGLQISSNYWLAWATEVEGRVSNEKLIGIFVLLAGGSSLFVLCRAVLLSTAAIKTAHKIFLGMINSVFRAPISFFDITPSSRILNRSSTDQGTVDTDIPYRVAGLAFALIQLLSVIFLMSYAYYITTARELARMVGIRKAPIQHHFSESIAGVTTIRSFKQEHRFVMKNLDLIDDYSRVTFHNYATMEWLCVRINFLFNLVFFIVLIILVSLPRSAISPSLAGLAATYGLNLNVLQAWVIWNLCNVENKMISVERILQYSKVPSEAPLVIEGSRPKPQWPTKGTIELDNLHFRYRPTLPMVLKGVTCTFPGGKKIGVVGRTGSGKSTLIQALFRVVEPSEGRILIDELDICKIGLMDLRSRLGIIPQDPTLFQGTMRTNLDPLNQHSDFEIWEVLSKCHLKEIVRQDARLLDAPVAEDGENWSVGQRQLLCLARVLLKKRKILVLDEATASVDTATDNVIQRTIREETSGCTVITVAHRIPTVIDNDLVLVLNEGKIVEYDSPTHLLNNQSSAFSKLVSEFLRRTKSDPS
ncbi:hypothetical protein Sjap_023368 [Stephania japonica]|uniref:Uncharacterized protein n=1 Tax=Stephania japonica TaxID=461633 RepID=A0AAP0EBG3_9MAGN